MTGIYKKFKSGTDIRGIGIGNGDEPLYMSDEFIARASAAFADFLVEKTGKAAEELTVAIGHDPRLSAERISAAVVRGLALRGVNIIDYVYGGARPTLRRIRADDREPPPGRQKRTEILYR